MIGGSRVNFEIQNFIWHNLLTFIHNLLTFKMVGLVWFMVFNATFNNISVISWRSVLLRGNTQLMITVPSIDRGRRNITAELYRFPVLKTSNCLVSYMIRFYIKLFINFFLFLHCSRRVTKGEVKCSCTAPVRLPKVKSSAPVGLTLLYLDLGQKLW